MKKFWKMTTLAMLGALTLPAASFGAAFAVGNTVPDVTARASETAAETDCVYLELANQQLIVYPTYYRLGGVETLFSGTYIIGGENSNNKIFFSGGDETPTYNVIFHDFNADNRSWNDVMQISEGVTLNITARGENVIRGYNHPGMQVENDYSEATVNITVEENASITFGANYSNQYPKSFGEGVTVNVLKGTASVDMTAEGWNNEDLTITNGMPASNHEISYRATAEGELCELYCVTEDVVLGQIPHEYVASEKDETYHTWTCENCSHSKDVEHNSYTMFVNETYCAPTCTDCGYIEKTLQQEHKYGNGTCEYCASQQLFIVEANGEKKAFAVLENAVAYANEQESATLSPMNNVMQGESTAYTVTSNVTLDLAGYDISNVTWIVDAEDASLTIVDSSAEVFEPDFYADGLEIMLNQGSLTIQNGSLGNVDIQVKNTFKSLTIEDGVFSYQVNIYCENKPTDGQSILLKGGVFHGGAYIDGGEDWMRFTDVIPEGLAVENEDGELHDLYENDIYEYGIFVEHTCEMAEQFDENYHWVGCVCGRLEGERAWHEGGEATCTETPVCDTCNNPYSEPLGHTFEDGNELCTVCKVGKRPFVVSVADEDFVFEDIYDAFEKANEYEEATITLQDNAVGVFYDAFVYSGKITLDLAGYSVAIDYISVSEGADTSGVELIIQDSSAEGTGSLFVRSINVWGVSLTINGGFIEGEIEVFGSDEE